MRTITKAELIEANRKALADGTLAALAPQPDCRYKLTVGDGKLYRCAIGCALTGKELDAIPYSSNATPIDEADLPVNFEDFLFARELQAAHDRWCQYGHREPQHADAYRAMLA